MKVLHLSTYDTNGGAARAAYALHQSMLQEGLASEMWVGRKGSDDPTVQSVAREKLRVTSILDRQLWKLQRSNAETWRSPARFSALSAEEINRSDVDIVNLHWITDGFLSIEEIGNIQKPIVWSMYDMWPFSGTEHYGTDGFDARWRSGYTRDNRPLNESGFDIDRWTYQRKVQHWLRQLSPIHMIPASTWLLDALQKSALMSGFPASLIPHVVDTTNFLPCRIGDARSLLGLTLRERVVLFIASAGIGDSRKGWSLLSRAIALSPALGTNLTAMIVGPIPDSAVRAKVARSCPARIKWLGIIDSDEMLKMTYCAADVTAVPSLADNLPLTVLEALSCGCPVVAFNNGGIPDLITHGVNGFLASENDPRDLSIQISAGLNLSRAPGVRRAIRKLAVDQWSPTTIVSQYNQVFETVISRGIRHDPKS